MATRASSGYFEQDAPRHWRDFGCSRVKSAFRKLKRDKLNELFYSLYDKDMEHKLVGRGSKPSSKPGTSTHQESVDRVILELSRCFEVSGIGSVDVYH